MNKAEVEKLIAESGVGAKTAKRLREAASRMSDSSATGTTRSAGHGASRPIAHELPEI